jgi:glycosyltransferase involved in cell wall biosynthesis
VKESRVIGLPVITTRCGGQSDYIEDGRNGFMVEPRDVATLTDRLHRLLSNAEYCRARGADGWEKDRAFFRPELTAGRFSDLYRDLAGRPKAA